MNFFLTLHSMPLLSWWSWKHSCSYYLTETHVLHREQTDRSELTWEGGKASGECMAWLSLCREQSISCPDSLLLTLAVFLATSPIPSRTGKMPCEPKLLKHLPWANVELISEQRNLSWDHTSNSCLVLTSGFFLPPHSPPPPNILLCKQMQNHGDVEGGICQGSEGGLCSCPWSFSAHTWPRSVSPAIPVYWQVWPIKESEKVSSRLEC